MAGCADLVTGGIAGSLGRRPVRGALLVLATAAALSVPTASAAAAPVDQTVLVQVLLSDRRIILATYQGETLGNGTPMYVVFGGVVPLGEYLRFVIFNHGKKEHDFSIFGKTTKPLKPGGLITFTTHANARGRFTYRSTLDNGKTFRGTMVIAHVVTTKGLNPLTSGLNPTDRG